MFNPFNPEGVGAMIEEADLTAAENMLHERLREYLSGPEIFDRIRILKKRVKESGRSPQVVGEEIIDEYWSHVPAD